MWVANRFPEIDGDQSDDIVDISMEGRTVAR